MLASVDLNDELRLVTREIGDEPSQTNLTTEMRTGYIQSVT